MSADAELQPWVLLNYRMPRVPSSPRVAVWRRLQALGVAQLSDGLVALPADARTREHLEWLAAEITGNSGTATVWIGRPATPASEQTIVAAMRKERRTEYLDLIRAAVAAQGLDDAERVRTARRLQQQRRKITRRDYFPPDERAISGELIQALLSADSTANTTDTKEATR